MTILNCVAKKGVALLITVFFVMLISVSLGVGLGFINSGKKIVDDEHFMYQNAMALEDVLRVLRSSPELQQIANANDLANFLLLSEVIPLQREGLSVLISFSSARSKINPSMLKEKNALESFKEFLIRREINPVYGDLIFDSISGIKEDQTYATDLFNQEPELFRNYIASEEHLRKIDSFYRNNFHDPKIQELDTKELFSYTNDKNSSIDINHATPKTLEILLACDDFRAEALSMNEMVYEKIEDMQLSNQEQLNLANFKTSFFEPYLDVSIEVIYQGKESHIRFEYNIETKKGSHFVFEV